MKLNELHILDARGNRGKARKIARNLKARARKANPTDEVTPNGWRADPHQGSLGGSLNWR